MKSMTTSFFVFLLLSSAGFTQSVSTRNEISTTDSLPVIYIPGIMGSPMYNDVNNDDILEDLEKAWFGILQFPSMWLAENGIDPASSNYNIKVAPLRNDTANTLRDELEEEPLDLFKGFFDNMEANGYIIDDYDDIHNEGENLFCFTYDWRKNNTYNAELLSDFIDSVITWTGTSTVNLVGHSMGGIVSKTCIKLFDNSRISKMVFIGTPHLGAPEILTVLLTGKLFDWLNFFIANDLIRSLGRNLTACYQLIPTRSYFDLNLYNGVSDSVEVYLECFQLPGGNYANYDEMIIYLRNLVYLFGEDLNDALLDSSEFFKESIDTVDFGNVEVFNIVGHNLLTIGKNRVYEFLPGIIAIEDERNLNGDYTVPVRSAELINGEIFEHTYYVRDTIHSGIPSSPETLEILLGVFSDPQITYFPQYANPPICYRNIDTNVVVASYDYGIISSFYLSQNFPNPFNPVTTIEYRVPSLSHVTLKLYDILGNEIATLVDEKKSYGFYELTLFARNLPSGVYFYQLKSESFVETKKMILMK